MLSGRFVAACRRLTGKQAARAVVACQASMLKLPLQRGAGFRSLIRSRHRKPGNREPTGSQGPLNGSKHQLLKQSLHSWIVEPEFETDSLSDIHDDSLNGYGTHRSRRLFPVHAVATIALLSTVDSNDKIYRCYCSLSRAIRAIQLQVLDLSMRLCLIYHPVAMITH
jgi:hypothetical protein